MDTRNINPFLFKQINWEIFDNEFLELAKVEFNIVLNLSKSRLTEDKIMKYSPISEMGDLKTLPFLSIEQKKAIQSILKDKI
jgi:hypothetical protein